MLPLNFEVTRLGKSTKRTDYTGRPIIEREPSDRVRVFSYAVINGNTVETSTLYSAPFLATVERLQIIAPAGLFPLLWGDTGTTVKLDNLGENWVRVDAEENYDNNPYWSPGLSVYYFERETESTEV